MVTTISITPGITLRHIADGRFKQGCLSIQLLRPMCREEAGLNALLPAVLLRGCENYPDLRSITERLDDLYGASVNALVRRVGDWQSTGFYCGFMEDRFAMPGDAILAPMVDFARQLLLEPCKKEEYVRSEQKNLISTIESQRNDKRAYAMEQLLARMCRNDSYGIPRLGEMKAVEAITAQGLWEHYDRLLKESKVELCYVGSVDAETVAAMLKDAFSDLASAPMALAPQTPLAGGDTGDFFEEMEVSQGKLCMGFASPTTTRDPDFAAMQVLNMIFGGGMTSKLFRHIREENSLCYAIGSGYYGSKGIVTVSAGIDSHMDGPVKAQVLEQLDAIREGHISPDELEAARQALRSSLLASNDSPGALEGYYATAALNGLPYTPEGYIRAVEAVTAQQVSQAAQSLQLRATFFLKGVQA